MDDVRDRFIDLYDPSRWSAIRSQNLATYLLLKITCDLKQKPVRSILIPRREASRMTIGLCPDRVA